MYNGIGNSTKGGKFVKNLKKIGAFLLAMAMLLTTTAAFAETSDELVMHTITINDIQVSLNDSLVMDLSGLSVSAGGVIDPVTGKGAVQLAALGGDEAAASAMAAWSSDKAVLSVDGLSQPLTLDVDMLLELLNSEEVWQVLLQLLAAQMGEEEAEAFIEMIEACSELFSDENLASMGEGMETYLTAVQEITMRCTSEPVAEVHDFAVLGTADAQCVEMNFTAEDIVSLLKAACAFYDSNPAILKLMNAALKLDGEDFEITSFEQALDLDEMPEIAVTAELYVSDDGSAVDMMMTVWEEDEPAVDVDMDVYSDGEETMLAFGLSDASDFESVDMQLTVSVMPSEEFAGETEISASLIVNEYGEEMSVSLWCGPDAYFGNMISMAIESDDETIGIAAAASDTRVVFTLYDDENTIEVGYVTEYDGAEAGEGQLYATIADSEDTVSITAMVHSTSSIITEAEIDELLSAEGIDLMSISEEDTETLANEAMMAMFQAIGVLTQNVPGLAELLDE